MTESKSAVLRYLKANGPTPGRELPREGEIPALNVVERENGVRKFNPSISSGKGGGTEGVGQTATVYYLEGDHDAADVIREWVDANPRVLEASPRAFVQAVNTVGKPFREVSKAVALELYGPERWADAYGGGGGGGKPVGEKTLAEKLEEADASEVFGDDE